MGANQSSSGNRSNATGERGRDGSQGSLNSASSASSGRPAANRNANGTDYSLTNAQDTGNHTEQGESIQTTTIKNRMNIKKDTLKLTPIENQPGKYNLEFSLDALTDCVITIFIYVRELVDPSYCTKSFAMNTTKYPPPQGFKLPSGMNQNFPTNVCIIDTTKYTLGELTNYTETTYPMIIHMEATNNETNTSIDGGYFANTLYCSFLPSSPCNSEENQHNNGCDGDGGEVCVCEGAKGLNSEVKVCRQKIQCRNKAFVLSEIYGIEDQVEGEADGCGGECVICYSERSNTMVLPCRHMCLCLECANVVTQQQINCPVCRTRITKMIHINREGQETNLT
eukprot:CAMPEP_0115046508 /NCGR_PEP_ID=MMETSP0216-20121206/48787_1 /TAXON_ID=223996 /ORGANISM="Protocruzia adherens, Strain Boccale" /LENGTH=338 /DNA_ID=CAMNT_0002429595 /DNA_START=36 /DNA_END=1052 /DNA_ORIENTATION=+